MRLGTQSCPAGNFQTISGERIILAAHAVNRGEMLHVVEKDLVIFMSLVRIPMMTQRRKYRNWSVNAYQKDLADPFEDIQLVCPTNKGRLGTQTLNRDLQLV